MFKFTANVKIRGFREFREFVVFVIQLPEFEKKTSTLGVTYRSDPSVPYSVLYIAFTWLYSRSVVRCLCELLVHE